jgi:hypothetical protein
MRRRERIHRYRMKITWRPFMAKNIIECFSSLKMAYIQNPNGIVSHSKRLRAVRDFLKPVVGTNGNGRISHLKLFYKKSNYLLDEL